METQSPLQPDDSAMDVHLEPAASSNNYVLMPFSDVDEDQIKTEWLMKKRPNKAKPKRSKVQRNFIALIAKAKYRQQNSESSDDESTNALSTELSDEANSADNNDIIDEEPSDDDGGDEGPVDAAGEEKVDGNGYLLGGRSYICPVFRSPCRRNPDTLYIPVAECCRYIGYGESKHLVKKHRSLRRYPLIKREREILYDNLSLNNQSFNSPAVYMVKARSAFKEFGALLVKNGRHIVDDYCEANWRSRDAYGPPCLSGQVVANMEIYRAFKANYMLVRPPTNYGSMASRLPRLPRIKMSEEMNRYFLRPFPVVGSSVELMLLVSERQQQRREFMRSLKADMQSTVQHMDEPVEPKCEKVESKIDRKLDLVPIVIDDSSEDGESSDDDDSSGDDDETSKGTLEPIVVDDSSD
ncbi:chromatin structure-remodeling complex subunit RSC7 [Coemansia sp. RSA 2337]|nr:chromatin structure-remodeling complex subunit RSC7 [Coemansia sp. RSA 2337]